MTADPQQTIVVFDADCGSCRWSADRLRAWDRRGELRFEPLLGPVADRWLGDLPQDVRTGSWHLVTPDGRVWSAGAAVAPLLRRLPGGVPLAAIASSFPGATDAAYDIVARHRSALGRLLGARACAVDPSSARRPA